MPNKPKGAVPSLNSFTAVGIENADRIGRSVPSFESHLPLSVVFRTGASPLSYHNDGRSIVALSVKQIYQLKHCLLMKTIICQALVLEHPSKQEG